jgi:hypothetical protein
MYLGIIENASSHPISPCARKHVETLSLTTRQELKLAVGSLDHILEAVMMVSKHFSRTTA